MTRTAQLFQVDLAASQPGQFAEPQAGEGGQKNERTVARRHPVEQLQQRWHRDHLPLRRVLLARALDPARVAADEPVVGGGVQDSVQQAVCLGLRAKGGLGRMPVHPIIIGPGKAGLLPCGWADGDGS